MSSLLEGLNSDYLHAANRLRSNSDSQSISVYVEGFEDIAFWHNILSPYEATQHIKFDIKTYSQTRFIDGCESLKKLFPNTGDSLIICLDSDYQHYLLAEYFGTSASDNPYVLQSYSHSIENLKCYAESLSGLCVQASNNTDETINPILFLQAYSKIIYKLFIWFLYFESIKDSRFCNSDFCAEIKVLEKPRIDDLGQSSLNKVQDKVTHKLQQLQQGYPEIIQEIEPLAEKLDTLGLSDINAYLFIQGHTLHDNVVLILLKSICESLEKSDIKNITSLAEQEEKEARIKGYRNSRKNIETLLATNGKFKDCFLFSKIEQDIQKIFDQRNRLAI